MFKNFSQTKTPGSIGTMPGTGYSGRRKKVNLIIEPKESQIGNKTVNETIGPSPFKNALLGNNPSS
jgi:hypothetical protein